MPGEACIPLSVDPSTPLSALIDSTVRGRAAKRILILDPHMTVREAFEAMVREGVDIGVIQSGNHREYKIVTLSSLALSMGDADKPVITARTEEAPVVEESSSLEELLRYMLIYGSDIALVTVEGRPSYAVSLKLFSLLAFETLDVEELRGAD